MKPAAARVLEFLYDRGDAFVALDELGGACGVRAGGLAGAMEELRAAGQRLEVSPAHGVRLVRPVRLDAHLLERDLGVTRVGRNVICFAEVDSTNDVAFEAAPQGQSDGLVVLAEHQRKGRGRQGHAWQSPPGANILMSLLLVDASLPHEAMTIGAGLAVAEGVESACGAACELHWPNDVCMEGRKLAGVLVEARRSGPRPCVVLGIGINANASPPWAGAARPATDLAFHVGAPVERIEVVRHVLRRLDYWIGEIGQGRLAELRQGWVRRCGILNRRLTVLSAGRRYVGRVLDVSPLDGLVLRCDQDTTVRLPAETSSIVPLP